MSYDIRKHPAQKPRDQQQLQIPFNTPKTIYLFSKSFSALEIYQFFFHLHVVSCRKPNIGKSTLAKKLSQKNIAVNSKIAKMFIF
uniref:Uncharacterized protein n=1 Tax=Leptospira mayottensis 200901116 TaxID=1192864 RepID=A0A343US37_9LEPT|nr:hypothetical protein [Leptospira mayottensis]AVH81610.1 hypothetical protein [Leptospira mayottensis 200901116]